MPVERIRLPSPCPIDEELEIFQDAEELGHVPVTDRLGLLTSQTKDICRFSMEDVQESAEVICYPLLAEVHQRTLAAFNHGSPPNLPPCPPLDVSHDEFWQIFRGLDTAKFDYRVQRVKYQLLNLAQEAIYLVKSWLS